MHGSHCHPKSDGERKWCCSLPIIHNILVYRCIWPGPTDSSSQLLLNILLYIPATIQHYNIILNACAAEFAYNILLLYSLVRCIITAGRAADEKFNIILHMYINVRCSVRVIDSIHTFLAGCIHKVVMETVYGSFGL